MNWYCTTMTKKTFVWNLKIERNVIFRRWNWWTIHLWIEVCWWKFHFKTWRSGYTFNGECGTKHQRISILHLHSENGLAGRKTRSFWENRGWYACRESNWTAGQLFGEAANAGCHIRMRRTLVFKIFYFFYRTYLIAEMMRIDRVGGEWGGGLLAQIKRWFLSEF